MTDRGFAGLGIVAAVGGVLCCLAPILAPLGAIGLSALLGWLDYALLSGLVLVGLAVYVLARRRRSRRGEEPGDDSTAAWLETDRR